MLIDNSRAIHLRTRSALRELVASGDLDEASARLLDRALEANLKGSSARWVLHLAEALGATRETALEVGSLAQLVCTATHVVDDIQDGDCDQYLGDVPSSIQVNVGMQLVALVGLAAARLERMIGPSGARLAERAMSDYLKFSCGQRLELAREEWSPRAYEQMTAQMAHEAHILVRAAAAASGTDPEPMLPLMRPLAVLMQMRCDEASRDPRFTALPAEAMAELRSQAIAEVGRILPGVPSAARPVFEALLRAATMEEARAAI